MKKLFLQLQAKEKPIVVVGLGYVGLPLARLLSERFKVIGYDIDIDRVAELNRGIDRTKEVDNVIHENIIYTSDPSFIGSSPFIIVCIPTPVIGKKPDLHPLRAATKTINFNLNRAPGWQTIIVYESTVYPGVTESLKQEFFPSDRVMVGYSPERVNPGDKKHTIDRITKVVSGETPEVASIIELVYGSVVNDIYLAPSIKVAEAAKVIENAQRDLNIAFMNELSCIFEVLDLDTKEVLKAAKTKWNFLDFEPGLVGGHCIGVDPYYLQAVAQQHGYNPKLIAAARDVNEKMPHKIVEKVFEKLGTIDRKSKIGVFGMTFKEDVPDSRNSKSFTIYHGLAGSFKYIYCHDPVLQCAECRPLKDIPPLDVAIVAVKHREYRQQEFINYLSTKLTGPKILIDIKGIFSKRHAMKLGFDYWSL